MFKCCKSKQFKCLNRLENECFWFFFVREAGWGFKHFIRLVQAIVNIAQYFTSSTERLNIYGYIKHCI